MVLLAYTAGTGSPFGCAEAGDPCLRCPWTGCREESGEALIPTAASCLSRSKSITWLAGSLPTVGRARKMFLLPWPLVLEVLGQTRPYLASLLSGVRAAAAGASGSVL